nr:hypothetical protein CFP56_11464 [Quercus suber]
MPAEWEEARAGAAELGGRDNGVAAEPSVPARIPTFCNSSLRRAGRRTLNTVYVLIWSGIPADSRCPESDRVPAT